MEGTSDGDLDAVDPVLEGALDAMSAEQLRGLIVGLLPWLDAGTRARLSDRAVQQAAEETEWAPERPAKGQVAEVEAVARLAVREGWAEASTIDACLREASHAFLACDYAAAAQMFGALLIPLGEGEIDLGQHEMLDEVLDVDLNACAWQYVVARYLVAAPEDRARAVRVAIEDVDGVGYFPEPLRGLDETASSPLPGFEDFLSRWRDTVEAQLACDKGALPHRDESRWLREVVLRIEGTEGLATLARKTRDTGDYRAWCKALVETRDWASARVAYEEAAEAVTGTYGRRTFLEGAALAAQELGTDDLEGLLERAWEAAPALDGLLRWLGQSPDRAALESKAKSALGRVPPDAGRQRVLLHALLGELDEMAALLEAAPGLGWSEPEHPGHLAFPLLAGVLEGNPVSVEMPRPAVQPWLRDQGPTLHTPTLSSRLAQAPLGDVAESTRANATRALRAAAEARLRGVTEYKRRRHYGHAAALAVRAARAGGPPGEAWLEVQLGRYRRFSALQRAFKTASAASAS